MTDRTTAPRWNASLPQGVDVSRIKLDDIDWGVIHALQEDASRTNKDIGKRLGVSEVTIAARIRSLEERCILRVIMQRNLGGERLSVLIF